VLYQKLLRPFLFQFDPEDIHTLTHRFGTFWQSSDALNSLLSTFFCESDDRLKWNFRDITFSNPLGLAAGFDKNAELISLMQALGFGFEEVGSITWESSKGNPKPRLFRLPEDEAIINRMGLNNEGAEKIAQSLKSELEDLDFPVGVNIAKTHSPDILGDLAIRDYVQSYQRLRDLGSYHCLNISCPNTAEGKTFEDPAVLRDLLSAISEERSYATPLLIKLSPDLSKEQTDELLNLAMEFELDGFVVSNTSVDRSELNASPNKLSNIGKGGLSGKPLAKKSNNVLNHVHKQRKPHQLLIGVGGVRDVNSAIDKFASGADLIQIYTGLVFEGPALVKRINSALVDRMKRDGLENIEELKLSLRD